MSETKLGKFIRLSVPEPLASKDSRKWFQTVCASISKGLIGSIQIKGDDNITRAVQMVGKRYSSGRAAYEIPLVRSLLDDEIEGIVDAWNQVYPTGEFQIESDADTVDSSYKGIPDIADSTMEDLAVEMAKYNHAIWANDMLAQGWRYGISFSEAERTHPLIMPWEQIPDSARRVNYELPSKFLEMLHKHGLLE